MKYYLVELFNEGFKKGSNINPQELVLVRAASRKIAIQIATDKVGIILNANWSVDTISELTEEEAIDEIGEREI